MPMRFAMKKKELFVVGALLAALLGLEICARIFEIRLSKDVAHIRSLPAEAERLREAPGGALKVLILGNSLARCGVDQAVLSQRLRGMTKREVAISVMHPDGSRVEEWHYGYRRYFDQTGAAPDVVLLCSGRLHLVDGLDDLDSVAAFYTSWRDMPDFMGRENLGVGAICQATVARLSALFAHRRRVQPLVFYNAMPRYEPTVNLIGRVRSLQASGEVEERALHCENFAGLADTVRLSGGQVLLLQVPLPEAYELPSRVLETAQEKGVRVLRADLSVPGERFPDGYHMDAQGAAHWTHWLLDRPVWSEILAAAQSAEKPAAQRE